MSDKLERKNLDLSRGKENFSGRKREKLDEENGAMVRGNYHHQRELIPTYLSLQHPHWIKPNQWWLR